MTVKKIIQKLDKEYLKRSMQMSVEERLEFLENFRLLHAASQEQGSTAISLRIDKHLLSVFKNKAKLEGEKYQTKIKELMRNYLNQ